MRGRSGGRRSSQAIHQGGKNAISHLRLAIQRECRFKLGVWKLLGKLLPTEAAGTNLENLLQIHAFGMAWTKASSSQESLWLRQVFLINYHHSYFLLTRLVCKGSLPREFEAVPVGQLWRITSYALKPGRTISKLSGQLTLAFPCICLLCMVLAGSGSGTPNILKMVKIMLVRMGGQRRSPALQTPLPYIASGFGCLTDTVSGSHCIT